MNDKEKFRSNLFPAFWEEINTWFISDILEAEKSLTFEEDCDKIEDNLEEELCEIF